MANSISYLKKGPLNIQLIYFFNYSQFFNINDFLFFLKKQFTYIVLEAIL